MSVCLLLLAIIFKTLRGSVTPKEHLRALSQLNAHMRSVRQSAGTQNANNLVVHCLWQGGSPAGWSLLSGIIGRAASAFCGLALAGSPLALRSARPFKSSSSSHRRLLLATNLGTLLQEQSTTQYACGQINPLVHTNSCFDRLEKVGNCSWKDSVKLH